MQVSILAAEDIPAKHRIVKVLDLHSYVYHCSFQKANVSTVSTKHGDHYHVDLSLPTAVHILHGRPTFHTKKLTSKKHTTAGIR
jgi:hypothetical protein